MSCGISLMFFTGAGGRHHDQAFEAGRVLEFKGVIGCLSTHGYKLIADSIQFKGGC